MEEISCFVFPTQRCHQSRAIGARRNLMKITVRYPAEIKTGREVLSKSIPLTSVFPDKSSLSEMQEQFERQQNLGPKRRHKTRLQCYGIVNYSCELNDLQRNMPIVIDPTLVTAAQTADIELSNQVKEKGNIRLLVRMFCLV